MAIYYGTSGTDNLVGTSGDDTFYFKVADFQYGDQINGNGGSDTLVFTTAGDISIGGIAGLSDSITSIRLANFGTNTIDVENRPQSVVIGGDGNDTVDSAALFVVGGGNDTGTRINSIQANGGQIDANDHIAGYLIGTITLATAGTADLANVTGFIALNVTATSGIDTITLGSGTFASRTVGPVPPQFAITAGAANDVIDASAETVAIVWNTGAGNDRLTGGAGYNLFDFAIADLDARDSISAGPGFGVVQFTTAGTITASALTALHGIGRIQLANGTNSIDLTGLPGATVIGGTGADTFRVTAAGIAGDHITGGGGADLVRFTTAGTIDASALAGLSGISQFFLWDGTNAIDVSGIAGAKVYEGAGTNTVTGAATVVMGHGDDTITAVGSIQAAGGAIDAHDHVSGTGTGSIAIATAGVSDLTNVSGFASLVLLATSGGDSVTIGAHTLGAGGTVTAGAAADHIDASATTAALTINTGAGDDVIVSGHGVETLIGGAGNDVYYVNNSGDKVIEAAGGGTDVVYASVSYALDNAQAVENLILTGTANINATGNAANNTITGNAGNNVLTGGGGADTFFVTYGHDTITDFGAGSAAGHDTLALDHRIAGDYASVMALAHQVGADVVFSYPGDSADTLTLQHVTLASLTASDFTFY